MAVLDEIPNIKNGDALDAQVIKDIAETAISVLGLPAGGTAGQIPVKKTGDDGDVEWKKLTASDVGAASSSDMDDLQDKKVQDIKIECESGGDYCIITFRVITKTLINDYYTLSNFLMEQDYSYNKPMAVSGTLYRNTGMEIERIPIHTLFYTSGTDQIQTTLYYNKDESDDIYLDEFPLFDVTVHRSGFQYY